MPSTIHFLDWGVILLYVLAIIGIGFYRSRTNRKDPDEYILVGRRLSLPGFVATLVTTWYGGILGVGENTYNFGIQTWFIFGLPYYVFAIIFAVWLAPKIRNALQTSIPDHFIKRYGKSTGPVSAIYLLFLASPAPYILSIGILLQFTLGVPFGWALIISTMVSLIYIWYGGFGAVIRTDILQFILMFGGFILLVGFAWARVGSPLSILAQLPDQHLSLTGGNTIQYILVWFFIALWTFVDPGFYQRCAAAQSPNTARRGILISVLFWFIFDLLTLTSGLYARVILPEANALFAFPHLGRELLPPLFYGLFFTGLLATIMSTIDSLGLISAVTFGRDILWQIQKYRQKFHGEDPTLLTQRGLIVMAIIALLLAFGLPSIVGLWYMTGSIIVPGLLVPFLLTFTNYQTPEKGALTFMILPVVVAIIWFLWGKLQGEYPMGLEPFYPGLLTSIITGLLVRNNK